MRKASASDWVKLTLSLLGYALATVSLVILLNFPGDCSPEVTDCGEGRRLASFVVLGLGVVWLVYLAVKFLRDSKKS